MYLRNTFNWADFSLCSVFVAASTMLLPMGEFPAYSETIVVTSTADTGAGSLRQAIIQANATTGRDTVCFAIPGTGPHTIQPQSSFDGIIDQLLLDGYSQPGATPATDSTPAILLIEVDGTHINDGTFGVLRVCSDSCAIRGMVINRFAESGIQIVPNGGTARGNVIEGCYLGTDVEGTRALGNGFAGAEIYFADSNLVGGVESSSRNLISGNVWGVFIWGGYHNVVIGNLIGTDASGAADLGNDYAGVSLSIAWENTIGGSFDGSRNVISGNDWGGISFYDSDRNLVAGNYIGTDITGQLCIENGDASIELSLSSENTIGGTSEYSRNVISCSGSGISFDDSHQNVILGNFIGTDALGVRALSNSETGVKIASSHDNIIGGAALGSKNVISGNSQGICIDSGIDNVILGNRIGVGANGLPLGNGGHGVLIVPPAMENTIGGTEDGAANIIAYNGGAGICVDPGGANLFLSNSIFSNNSLGIDIGNDGVTPIDPDDDVQDYPVLTSVVSSAGHTTIQGTLQSAPSTEFHLEFFSNTDPDPSTYGEGEVFLGFASVSTDEAGEAEFIISLPVSVAGGKYVSATTTDLGDASSEFSQVAFVMTLSGDIVGDLLALWWTPVPSVAQYWLYGATNATHFEPGLFSPYENRLAILPPGTTAWGSPDGLADPYSNWTYLVLAVDGSNQEIARTNRFGEFDFSTPCQ